VCLGESFEWKEGFRVGYGIIYNNPHIINFADSCCKSDLG
jgi:hypothetical protein